MSNCQELKAVFSFPDKTKKTLRKTALLASFCIFPISTYLLIDNKLWF